MTDNSDLLKLPAGLLTTRDPVGPNPFSQDDPHHEVWSEATRKAEQELSRWNDLMLGISDQEMPRPRPNDPAVSSKALAAGHVAWVIELVSGIFDIWAKRGIQVVWTYDEVTTYDRWLATYAEGWLEMVGLGLERGSLSELRTRLIQRVEHWKAEARRYVAGQKAYLATLPSDANAPNDANGNLLAKFLGRHETPTATRLSIIYKCMKEKPHMSAEDLCKRLDFENNPPLEEWSDKHGVKTWSDAYRKLKLRGTIQSKFSRWKEQLQKTYGLTF
jgi:hypothetical protein